MNTSWTSPKTNIFAAINDLRKCLACGYKARIIRLENEKCAFPIREKDSDNNFRNYEFNIGYVTSVNKIKVDPNLNEFEKYLTLNYVSVFGSKEAAERYYQTGEYGADNFMNTGFAHLVKVDDLIAYLKSIKDYQRASMYERQYRAPEHENDVSYFFDFFSYNHGSLYSIKKFKHKLWGS